MWVLETTWRLVDKRFSIRWDPMREQSLILRLGPAITEILKVYWIWRVEEAGEEV